MILFSLGSHAGLSSRGEEKGGNWFLKISGLRSVVLLYLSDPSHFHMLFTGESYLTKLVQPFHFLAIQFHSWGKLKVSQVRLKVLGKIKINSVESLLSHSCCYK